MDQGAEFYNRYINGDDKGFYDLVRSYFDGLCAFIYGMTGDRGQSEELADDTFYRLAVKKPRYDQKSSFKTWLYSIGRHVAADALRKAKTDPASSIDDEPSASDGDTPEKTYLQDERKKTLYAAMNKLKAEYRQVLWLTFFENMSAEEVSLVMHKSKNNVYTLLCRAKDSLKTKLEEEGFNNEEL